MYSGLKILAGDEIVEFDGEVVLKEHLEEFLKDLGFEFKKAE
jgi:transposase